MFIVISVLEGEKVRSGPESVGGSICLCLFLKSMGLVLITLFISCILKDNQNQI